MSPSLKTLRDVSATTAKLTARGMSRAAAATKAKMFARCAEALAEKAGSSPAIHAFFVPGRIEVLGKHTDYGGGRSLVVAVEQGFCAIAAPRKDNRLRIFDPTVGEVTDDFVISPDLLPQVGQWSNYVQTVCRRAARNFPGGLKGADVAFTSDLPQSAGLSSSSALVVLTFLILDRVNTLSEREQYRRHISTPEDLGEYLGCNENGQNFGTLLGDKGVGTFGGSQDHTAILCSKADTISQYSFSLVTLERQVPMPPGQVFAVGASGVVANKTREAMEFFNRASRKVSVAMNLWRQGTKRMDPNLAAAVRSGPDALERFKAIVRRQKTEFTPDELIERVEMFIEESEQIIPVAGNALLRKDLAEWGRLVDRSHEITHTKLKNTTPETDYLPRAARRLGATAASAFGAGFGGSAWAMVSIDKADSFLAAWREDYFKAFPEPAKQSAFFLTRAAPAAFQL